MSFQKQTDERDFWEIRVFLEEICSNLCRFLHSKADGVLPEAVLINQEVYLGVPGSFADIRVQRPGKPPYFMEIKYGYPRDKIIGHLSRKYGPGTPGINGADRLIVVLDPRTYQECDSIVSALRGALAPGLTLEVWDEAKLIGLMHECFDLKVDSLAPDNLHQVRAALDRAKGLCAFGDTWTGDPMQRALLWHFGFWRLRQLRDQGGFSCQEVLPPDTYPNVVVLLADLSSFSSYVRDTPDDTIVRQWLTSFYSRARYQVLNSGGMMYQFVGDEVIGIFGLPERTSGYLEDAFECARALVDIGNSVSHGWQRQIDRVQQNRGVHIGMAMGELQIVALRPFGHDSIGAVSDTINVAARLLSCAGSGEMVVSNIYYQGLSEKSRAAFQPLESIEARNLGRINAWKLQLEGARGASGT